jgi:hypothetical protein
MQRVKTRQKERNHTEYGRRGNVKREGKQCKTDK